MPSFKFTLISYKGILDPVEIQGERKRKKEKERERWKE
jgi:hypothetical protein